MNTIKNTDSLRWLVDEDTLKSWRCSSISAVLEVYRHYPKAKWKHYTYVYEGPYSERGYYLVIFQWSPYQ